jgi:hypothetical protein
MLLYFDLLAPQGVLVAKPENRKPYLIEWHPICILDPSKAVKIRERT